MLTVSQLSCERNGRCLFADLSFSLGAGQALLVEGGNGAGKTTLLRILCGLYTEFTGNIDWQLTQPPLYLGHKPGVKDLLSARENLLWLAGLQQHVSPDAVNRALAAVGLQGFEDVPCGAMSEGQRKRVNLARLYLLDNAAWILDEPFSAIDVSGISGLQARLDEHLQARGLLIMISHQQLDLSVPVTRLRLGA